ncbi:hypothetical protein PYH37_002963 [Sinorhizobium numidicum]|uniref:Uncharacterized protein n=1 Tax=Sinorhizobium numidicum TaxID=680248 RepID=A0ABY8D1K1_9HYPH|nr:hypothetical protein [Sinorhizobium numidicum]WEX78111.1 hypothetical protein PYH37_002963 [Sinorhizobium numidicum]WEX84770.1 hypothetical protein PYH38_003676 [Sinorhizobium numidicum]
MTQPEEFKERPPIDPATGQPTPRETETRRAWSGRSTWPLLIILLAGLVLALIAWLPAELTRDAEDTTQPPATSDQSTTTQPPAAEPTTPPATETTPAAPETPPAPQTPATPAPQPQSPPAQ